MNIYYIRRNVNENEHERNLDFGEQSSSLCSSLSSGFDFVEFTVKKKKKLFYDSIERIVFVCLILSHTFSVFFFLNSMPKPIY